MRLGIVGGGVGGMMTALYQAAKGMPITLYERSELMGGRLAYETDGGAYRIDRGPTIVLLPDMLKSRLMEAGIPEERIPLVPLDLMYRIHYADGTVLTKYRDKERMEEELERLHPGEGKAFRRYMADMEPRFIEARQAFLERAFLRKRDFFTPRNLRLLGRMQVFKSASRLADYYFRTEKAADAFSLQTLYVGGLPFGTPSLYSFIPYAEHADGIWYWKGGYGALAGLLEEKVRAAGVDVRTGEEGSVKQIVTGTGRVSGLVTEDGVYHKHEAVVYNGDFPGLHRLLDRTETDIPIRKFKPSSGCVLIYLGCSTRWGHGRKAVSGPGAEGQTGRTATDWSVTVHQYFLPRSLRASLRRIASTGRPPAEREEIPAYYIFNPCAVDPEAAPAGESVLYVLIPMPVACDGERSGNAGVEWKQAAEQLADRVLADAEERAFPGLRESIRWKSVRSPADGAAEGWHGGGAFGIAPTLNQSGVFRPQIVPYPVRGLYSVGASVHPGGGIPIVMQGARLLADQLEREWPQ
ncbi:phytoene desaturase [Paenibacillus sambharensis]|uniref:Phytoene desaturase n=1 Tax=Paenibacillus sambharensis TaxID=1803190 RepID=A0A2W1L3Z8_9BACL|nr:FAD-dependent oxidoreductase [Paenibacillus sambharensis]PZD94076.1 phytoene desaturase [Paenibacillus sambharensis]